MGGVIGGVIGGVKGGWAPIGCLSWNKNVKVKIEVKTKDRNILSFTIPLL